MTQKLDKCPYCEGTYPHQGPTGCEPLRLCSLCGKYRVCRHETPVDPPFYPSEPGHHCDECENWLLTGSRDPNGGSNA
jgi:hypothetical protein